MVGIALEGRGGVASVLRTWRQEGLFTSWNLRYVPTNGSGGAARKLAVAMRAWLICAWEMSLGGTQMVHVHTSSYVSFWRKTPVLALAILTRRRLIVSLHGGAFRDFYATRGWVAKGWIRMVMRRSQRFVVLTEEWSRWASSTEPRSKVRVIPNPAPFLPPLATGAEQLGGNLLLFLGRVETEKGIYFLLEALAQARSAGAQWQLACGGTGELTTAEQAARSWGLGPEAVRFLGWIDGDAKHRWLERCAVLVLPSLIENMPVVILEAFAYAKPVIATRVGGVPDIVSDNVDGFLVDPRDVARLAHALVEAFKDAERLRAMGLRGRSKVELRYSAKQVVAQVDALYRECLGVAVTDA